MKDPLFNSINERTLVRRIGQPEDVGSVHSLGRYEKLTIIIDRGSLPLSHEVWVHHWRDDRCQWRLCALVKMYLLPHFIIAYKN